ncbi:hypothetical protein EDD16DRAFT_1519062 [Pisolithus croceorrhizus]|nr:hypothetical protein EDD16DRAFT_1519062 [Pisolithus croceorrhizus]KAI6122098.1 hypothetical protein EV401DRAFT_1887322 [Pisolithus croceorrhizus]
MFVKNSLALQDTVNCILTIFEMLIVNLGRLDKVEKLEQWRNTESVRSIANRIDNIPHMLIGMDNPLPPIESIAGHPWLLTIKRQYDVGLQVQPPAPTTEPTSISLEVVYHASHGSQGVSRAYTNMKHSIG